MRDFLDVIGAGWGRTGTLSLYEALNALGYRTHHMEEFRRGRADKTPWVLLGRGDARGDLATALTGYTAACDYPSSLYYKELLQLYPTAKVVLTTRDAEKWYESTRSTNWAIPIVVGQTWLLRFFFAGFMRDAEDMIMRRTIGSQTKIPDREHCIAAYNRHVEEVKRSVPAPQLLVFDVKEGWEPLCRFLGKPVPATPFPHTNEANEFKKALRFIVIADRVLTASLVCGLAAVAAWALNRA